MATPKKDAAAKADDGHTNDTADVAAAPMAEVSAPISAALAEAMAAAPTAEVHGALHALSVALQDLKARVTSVEGHLPQDSAHIVEAIKAL